MLSLLIIASLLVRLPNALQKLNHCKEHTVEQLNKKQVSWSNLILLNFTTSSV